MGEVEALALQGAVEGTVVLAEEQTAGRGRRGRTWESAPHSGLWLSLLLRPGRSMENLGWLPLVAGVGVARGLREATSIPVRLKWPNDIVVVGDADVRKVAGLLAERLADGAVVLGIGINVHHVADELPPGGTSLDLEGSTATRAEVLTAVLSHVATAYRSWRAGADLMDDYIELSATLGGRVRVETPGGAVLGQAQAVLEGGELLVVDDDQVSHRLSAGDVVHLRPTPG